MRVAAFSLNRGEVDGVVVRAAADGSGPGVGDRVVTLGEGGAWAELRAVDTALVGAVPDGVDLAAASTLPVAAGSALRALHRVGPLLGRRGLVTGAGGGVGRFAVQLAALGGAHVVAATSTPAHVDALRALGADEVVLTGAAEPAGSSTPDGGAGLVPSGPVYGVVETVGGESNW